MMAGEIYTLRQALKTAAESVTDGDTPATYSLSAATVKLGYDNRAAGNTFIRTNSCFLLIKPGARVDHSRQTDISRYRVECDLWFGITRETDADFVQEEKLLTALSTAWEQHAVTWEFRGIDARRDPCTVHYTVDVELLGGC